MVVSIDGGLSFPFSYLIGERTWIALLGETLDAKVHCKHSQHHLKLQKSVK